MCECEVCGEYIDGTTRMVMLKDDLWLSIAEKEDILCDKCIVKRLGRKIVVSDFKLGFAGHIPCNIIYAYDNNIKI